MTVYYLSGPMTGRPEFNYPYFNAMAEMLRAMNLEVLSPAEIDGGDQVTNGEAESKPYSYCLKKAMEMMCQADAIIMLEGWTSSKGALAELTFMLTCGLPAYRVELHNNTVYLVPLDAGLEHPQP